MAANINIGEKIVLHSVAFPHLTSDQDEFLLVEVVEIKDVPGHYGTPGKGQRAVEKKTGREFFCNWERFDDLSMSPYWSWWEPKGQRSWYDVTLGQISVPKKPLWLKGKFAQIVGWCKDHKLLFTKGEEFNCPLCDCDVPPEKDPAAPARWVGWY